MQKQGNGNHGFQNKGQGKENQPEENQFQPQEKEGTGNTQKDIGNWCEFNKIPQQNSNECQPEQSMVAKNKYLDLDFGFNFYL